MNKNNCIIPNTHKRLNEVHMLIHQVANNYFNPEAFRVNLNAAIQAIRNLTFALQAEKNSIGSEFDEWYLSWQNKMKKDKIMKWLNDLRVTIVHMKDLESSSVAKVKVYTYEQVLVEHCAIPIDLPNNIILQFLIENQFINPISSKLEMIVEVERKWVENSFPETELVSVLNYCFKFLYDLVEDAHEKFGVSLNECSISDSLHECEFIDGRLKCIEDFNEARRTSFSAGDLSIRKVRTESMQINDTITKKAIKRYGIKTETKKMNEKVLPEDGLFQLIIEQSKAVLKKDKYHRSMAFIFDNAGSPQMIGLEINDKSTKYIIMHKLAQLVRDNKSRALITIFETWVSQDLVGYNKEESLENVEDKRECLSISLIKNDGSQKHVNIFFKRNLMNTITFEEITENAVIEANAFRPIMEVWGY
ncbi:hypothetical protein [Fusibacter ferrireducens]|uniref:Uncharacterized protein n=1 Tax=Fusibacter ferrireducens TaxID=2785058 RepID=A0ABS0A0U5_9FIRM|nr:hypothetical protein [Fusibacter ferrireducens]MBF4696078.1 hypothetical protein [Fusibacter ferrireducens]